MAGLAVECALKAYLAGDVKAHHFPDKDFVNAMYVLTSVQIACLGQRSASHDAEQGRCRWCPNSHGDFWDDSEDAALPLRVCDSDTPTGTLDRLLEAGVCPRQHHAR